MVLNTILCARGGHPRTKKGRFEQIEVMDYHPMILRALKTVDDRYTLYKRCIARENISLDRCCDLEIWLGLEG